MSNPLKFLASHNLLQTFLVGEGFHCNELYLLCYNDIIVDEENYYSIYVNFNGTNKIVEVDILESIIWGEKEKKIDYVKGYLDNYFYAEGPFAQFGRNGFLEFNIIETGLPSGLNNAYWYLDQWKREILIIGT